MSSAVIPHSLIPEVKKDESEFRIEGPDAHLFTIVGDKVRLIDDGTAAQRKKDALGRRRFEILLFYPNDPVGRKFTLAIVPGKKGLKIIKRK